MAGTKFYVDPNSGAATGPGPLPPLQPGHGRRCSATSPPSPARTASTCGTWAPTSRARSRTTSRAPRSSSPAPPSCSRPTRLVHDHCGYTATPAMAARYEDFMHQVAAGIGNYHVVFFLELDSLITAPCLTHQQLAIREAELRVRRHRAGGRSPRGRLPRRRRRGRGPLPADGHVAARLRRRPGPGLLPQLHPLRLDDAPRSTTASRSPAGSAAPTSWSTPARTARARSFPSAASATATRFSATRPVAAWARCR